MAEDESADEPEASGTSAPRPSDPHVDQPGRFAYKPALDGIRALAVVVIMMYHFAQMTTDPILLFPGGILSVDLFFVLSGYLITTLLLFEWDSTGTINFKRFYLRRARRLLPALVLVMGAVAAMFLFRDAIGFDSGQIESFRRDAISTLAYVANWNFAFSGQSYFEQFGAPSPLQHMWTLAIEEQFYLIWPIMLFVGLKYIKLSRRAFALVAIVGAWASAVLMAVNFDQDVDPSRLYYGTDTRVQAMLVGVFGAFALFKMPTGWTKKYGGQALGFVAVTTLILMFVLASDDPREAPWIYNGGFLLTSIIGMAAVSAGIGSKNTAYARMMGWLPFRWIGRLSYGLYLIHWPVLVLLDSQRTGLGGLPLMLLRIAVTFSLATLSFYLIESPIRFHGLKRSSTRILSIVGGAAAIWFILAAVITVVPGDDDVFANVDAAEDGSINVDGGPVDAGDAKVIVVGDSMAYTLFVLRPDDIPGYAVRTSSMLGCGIVAGDYISEGVSITPPYGECGDWPQRWGEQIRQYKPDVTVVMVGGWEIFDHEINGVVYEVGTEAYATYLRGELNQIKQITGNNGSELVLLNVPCFKVLKPGTPGSWPEKDDTSRVDWVNSVFEEWADENGVELGDIHGLLCPDGEFVGEVDGVAYTDDGTHYTEQGAPIVWNWLTPQLDRILGQR